MSLLLHLNYFVPNQFPKRQLLQSQVCLLLPLESRRRNERGRYDLATSIDLEAGKMGGLGVSSVMARVNGVFRPGA
jgi:hypothetical protein